jgi:uncharacterized protein YukE
MGDSWVGGDIGGLHTMATTYKNAKDQLDDVVRPVTSAVESLVDDAGWKGDAAEEFRSKWSEDALTAGAFASLVFEAGDILGTLADALSTCETALQNAEHVATGKGVSMGAKGIPLPMVTANPPGAADQKTISAMTEYDTVRKQVMHTAQHARLVAADKLRGLYAQVTAPVSASDKITIADALCTPMTRRTRGPGARRRAPSSTTPRPRSRRRRRRCGRSARPTRRRAAGCPRTCPPRAPTGTRS